ncbi:MAG TPA: L-erythro-3,5-diaminohexanoate dehydrogenase [Steroidobacteraceae bacterium]|nr:L-erythro-3,5-diaminohexanoate dehydrogenase [Steroidobacteraceae bacterium]
MRAALLTLVEQRGKLHNRVTNSGGILIGSVTTVGPDYPDPPAVGTRIATLASLTLTPLRLTELGAVDTESNTIEARGTAFLFQCAPWIELPKDIPEEIALAALDVAGAPARVKARTRRGMRVLIVGAGSSGTLAAIAAAEAGAGEVIVTDVNDRRLSRLTVLDLKGLRTAVADATEAIEFASRAGSPADLTVSCVDRPGAELGCILATRSDGHILFFSMTTVFTRAALGAEGVGSGATLEIGNGFYPGHAALVIEILRRYPVVGDLLRPEKGP